MTYYNLLGYNIFTTKEVFSIKIIKNKQYLRTLKKVLVSTHKDKELKILEKIEKLIIQSENMKELMLNPLRIIYNIEQKKGNLKEIFTADLNSKLRLYMKPIDDYPYDKLEHIIEIEFVTIDDKHYGDG